MNAPAPTKTLRQAAPATGSDTRPPAAAPRAAGSACEPPSLLAVLRSSRVRAWVPAHLIESLRTAP